MQSPAVLHGRTYRWLRLQVEGLLNVPPRVVTDRWGRVHVVPTTRVGIALSPPDFHPPAAAFAAAARPEE